MWAILALIALAFAAFCHGIGGHAGSWAIWLIIAAGILLAIGQLTGAWVPWRKP